MTTDKKTNQLSLGATALAAIYAALFWSRLVPAQLLVVLFWLVVVAVVVVLVRIRRSPIASALAVIVAVSVLVATAPTALAWTAWGFNGFAP